MYGLIIENMVQYIKETYGNDKWDKIRNDIGLEQTSFSTHQVYGENIIPKLGAKAIEVLNITEKEFFYQMGVFFVSFVRPYGYDRVLLVLGRHMRDFLNGLDNLHEYLKFSYPRMKAPSFICENETSQGLTLHYRSKRKGFVYYTMGQIQEVARYFYHKEMKIELIEEEFLFDMIHTTFQLTFDNRAFTLTSLAMTTEEKHLPISASILFEIFPFCVVFSSDMIVKNAGNSLAALLPNILGKRLTNWFDLVRPLITFNFQTIINRTNNVFELISIEPVLNNKSFQGSTREIVQNYDVDIQDDKNLRLKGQMIYMDSWNAMMFLGTPVMPDLNSLIYSGLYINDLSMHDFSRDLMLAGTQQSVELKLALDQEQQKSKKLEESMKRLDEEMKRTDELLYQMIPKQVADRLRAGENAITTCEMFDSVSILFSDVVTFTEICSRITPMQVVSMLNGMYSIFDRLSEENKVYKVETIGDAYMVVSGAPQRETDHAERVCKMALDMVDAITTLHDPSTGKHLEVRIGVHTGTVVAGVVGLKMPRYCLFGDTVNIASKMESTSESMKIHISQPTKDLLPSSYHATPCSKMRIKEAGLLRTYWLQTRNIRSQSDRIERHLMHGSSAFAANKTKFSGVPVIYCDVVRRPTDFSAKTIHREFLALTEKWTPHNPADFFGSEINNVTLSTYNNQHVQNKYTSQKQNTSLKQNVPIFAPNSVNNIINELKLNTISTRSNMINTKPQRAGKMSTYSTSRVNESNSELGNSKTLSYHENYSSNNSLNQCCSRFNLNHKQKFQTSACSIT